jgi:hypothetical protein
MEGTPAPEAKIMTSRESMTPTASKCYDIYDKARAFYRSVVKPAMEKKEAEEDMKIEIVHKASDSKSED